MLIKTKIINNINLPVEITLQKHLEHIAKKIIIPDIEQGIDTGHAIVGGMLPHNEPATAMRKAGNYVGRLYKQTGEKRKNFVSLESRNLVPLSSGRPLIDTGKLRKSFFWKTLDKTRVLISIEGDRKAIGGYLQEGIDTDHGIKQYQFFGISKNAYDRAIKYMAEKLKKELTSGGKRGG
jgi:hypothetical protein